MIRTGSRKSASHPSRMSAAEYRATAKPKKSKYGNRKVVVDGIEFDSRREAGRWAELQRLEKAGAIRNLVWQPVFVLAPSIRIEGEARARPAIRYRADAGYVVAISCRAVVEDTKSPSTAMESTFRLKQHLMKSVHGIDVRVRQ